VALNHLGEGWHNNHHRYQSSTNQGFFWWEIDISYYLISCSMPGAGVEHPQADPPHSRLIPENERNRWYILRASVVQ